MKISLRIKVILLTVILSLALIGASVLISSLIFTSRMQKDAASDCATAASNMTERIEEDVELYEFVRNYVQEMKTIYADNYDDLVYHCDNGFDSKEDEEAYYTELTRHLYPSGGGMFGMSYQQAKFQNGYNNLLHEFILVSNNFDTEGGYLYMYDSQHDYVIYLMDSTATDSPLHAYAASIQHPSELWKSHTAGSATVSTYFKSIYDAMFCYANSPVVDKDTGEVIAYVGYNYNMNKLLSRQYEFVGTITVIMLIAMVVITVIYLVVAEFMLIKNIRRLSQSTLAFTAKLHTDGDLTPVDCHVNAKDEVGTLATQFGVMQNSIVQYVDTIAQKAQAEHRLAAEMSIATQIQAEELPAARYEDTRVSICADFTSAKEVGGDFYDYFYVDPTHIAVVMADVSGKGVPAALFMMKAKGYIKNKLLSTKDVCRTMSEVNNTLLQNNRAGLFVTAFLGVIDLANSRMTCVSAGHERPYLVGEGKVERLDVDANFVLSGIPDFAYKANEVDLTGKRLFLFTDGLNEAIDGDNTEFGYQRIEDTLAAAAHLSQDEMLAAVKEALSAFVGEREPFDDVTLMSVSLRVQGVHLVLNNPDYSAIERVTASFDEAFGHLNGEVRSRMDVAIDEVLNNLISYEKTTDFVVSVDAEVVGKELRLTFGSNGAPFNPLQVAETNTDAPTLGGYGIAITKSMCDDIAYRREGDKNILTLTKHI